MKGNENVTEIDGSDYDSGRVNVGMYDHIDGGTITLYIVYICTYLQLCTEGLGCANPTHSTMTTLSRGPL